MAQDALATDASGRLLELAQAMASNAALQVDASRQLLQIETRNYDAGASTFLDYREAVLAFADAEMQFKRAELDVAEIKATGAPVRIDLDAPLVEGRDFVNERLQLEFDAIARRSTQIEEIIEFTEAEIEAGVATSNSMAPLTIERSRLATEAERIRTMQALRRNQIAAVEPDQAREE